MNVFSFFWLSYKKNTSRQVSQFQARLQ